MTRPGKFARQVRLSPQENPNSNCDQNVKLPHNLDFALHMDLTVPLLFVLNGTLTMVRISHICIALALDRDPCNDNLPQGKMKGNGHQSRI